MFQEFKKFAMRGNVLDMAVGVIIGGAFGKIVSSVVDDVIMPPIGWLIGGVNFADLKFTSKEDIFESFRRLHPILKEEHFLNPKEDEDDPYESTQITALVANRHGIYGVYSMREVFEYAQYWAAGTGREFALGAMWSMYDRLPTAEAVARAGVEAGAVFDRNSGLPLTLYRTELDPSVRG